MQSATANTPMIAPRSVIITDAATIQHQDRIGVGFASLDAKRCQLRLDLAQCAVLRRESFSSLFGQCFRHCAGAEKTSFNSGEWRTNALVAPCSKSSSY